MTQIPLSRDSDVAGPGANESNMIIDSPSPSTVSSSNRSCYSSSVKGVLRSVEYANKSFIMSILVSHSVTFPPYATGEHLQTLDFDDSRR